MKKKMDSIDRTIRLIVALLIGILYLAGQITGTLAIILGIVAAIILMVSTLKVRPLYVISMLSCAKELH